jgi:hypothetical protein
MKWLMKSGNETAHAQLTLLDIGERGFPYNDRKNSGSIYQERAGNTFTDTAKRKRKSGFLRPICDTLSSLQIPTKQPNHESKHKSILIF